MIIFSGTSNPKLAASIAKELDLPLGNVEITRFIDNECRVFIKEDVAGQDVVVIQSLSQIADQHLVELCLLGQAIKDMGAKKVTAVIPWMGYSKQDKAFRKGEAISSQLVAKFIEAAGFDNVITVELHSENVIPYFHIPVTELSTHELLIQSLQKSINVSAADTCVVSPDKGGKSRSEAFAKAANLSVVYLEKSRDLETGVVTITGIEGEMKGKDMIIFDDIINTGSTAIGASAFLRNKLARHVYLVATHAVLAGNSAKDIAASDIDNIIVTDSIHITSSQNFGKLSFVSLAPILAVAISASLR